MASGELRVSAVAAPLRAQVVRKLREAILSRRFPPGQRLVERELCELTGVSRTTVREALRQLESEGLVRLVANQGPVVASVSLEEARDLYEVRGVLEALAASRFAAGASDGQMRRLLEATRRYEQAARAGDLTEIVERKDDLYAVLLDGADNSVIRQVLESLRGRIAYLRATSLRQPHRAEEAAREIRKIAAAIAGRDAGAAWDLSRWHVDRAAAAALEVLAAEGRQQQ